MQEVSSISHLLFNSSQVKRQKEKNSLERKHEIICFMFRNNFFDRNAVEEQRTLTALKKKRGSAKSDVSKVLFPDIGKITNFKHHDRKLMNDIISQKQVPYSPKNHYFTQQIPSSITTSLRIQTFQRERCYIQHSNLFFEQTNSHNNL